MSRFIEKREYKETCLNVHVPKSSERKVGNSYSYEISDGKTTYRHKHLSRAVYFALCIAFMITCACAAAGVGMYYGGVFNKAIAVDTTLTTTTTKPRVTTVDSTTREIATTEAPATTSKTVGITTITSQEATADSTTVEIIIEQTNPATTSKPVDTTTTTTTTPLETTAGSTTVDITTADTPPVTTSMPESITTAINGYWSYWKPWSDCSITCGSGTQRRNRECDNPPPANGGDYCVGINAEERSCAKWQCPDCSITCPDGSTLSVECDACICNNIVLSGAVKNIDGVALHQVKVARISAPYRPLNTTNTEGMFKLMELCSEEVSLVFIKEGYLDAVHNITLTASTSITVEMKKLVATYITEHPLDRIRFETETVRFCCNADGMPAPTKYEWFKDGNILNPNLYNYTSELHIHNLSVNHSGLYSCRAISDVRAAYSKQATLLVKYASSPSCDEVPLPLNKSIPSGCTAINGLSSYNFGQCSTDACSVPGNNETDCRQLTQYCCGPVGFTQDVHVTCFGNFNTSLTRIVRCGCQRCIKESQIVRGSAYGLQNGTRIPLNYGKITVLGRSYYTSASGDFSFSLAPDLGVTSIVIRFQDQFNDKLADTIKVVSISSGDNLLGEVQMKLKNPAFYFSAKNGTTVSVKGGTLNETLSPAAELDIFPDSLLNKDGTAYEGEVEASVTFNDPRDLEDVREAPGDFVFLDEEGEEKPLYTNGLFTFSVKDSSGNELQLSENAELEVDAEALNIKTDSLGSSPTKLWTLNLNTGIWEFVADLKTESKRKRKRRSGRVFFYAEIPDAQSFYNFDCQYEKLCYVKVKAYEDDTLITPITSVRFTAIGQERKGPQLDHTGPFYGYRESTGRGDRGLCIQTRCDHGGFILATLDGHHLVPSLKKVGTLDGTFHKANMTYGTQNVKAAALYADGNVDGPVYRYLARLEHARTRCYYAASDSNHIAFYDVETDPPSYKHSDHGPNFAVSPPLLWQAPFDKDPYTCFIKIVVRSYSNVQPIARVISYKNTNNLTYGWEQDSLERISGTSQYVGCLEFRCSESDKRTKVEISVDLSRCYSHSHPAGSQHQVQDITNNQFQFIQGYRARGDGVYQERSDTATVKGQCRNDDNGAADLNTDNPLISLTCY